MKNLTGIILTIAVPVMLTACTQSVKLENSVDAASPHVSQASSQSRSESSEDKKMPVERSMFSAEEKEVLRQQAVDFSVNFPDTFETPNDLSTESVGWYTFWQLFNQDPTQKLQDGYCLLSDDAVNQYVSTHFGMEQLIWTADLPKYDVSEGLYYFYPVGEPPLMEGEIIGEAFSDNNETVIFTIALYRPAMGTENPREQVATIDYLFRILPNTEKDKAELQIVSATSAVKQ